MYDAAPTSLHDSVPLSGTFVTPLPGDALVGAEVGQPVVSVALPLLFALFGSGVVDVAVAVLVTVVVGPARTVYVA